MALTREAVWWRSTWNGVLAGASRLGWRGAVVDVDLLLERARREADADDFGDLEFLEPMRVLVREFGERARADVIGRQAFVQVLLGCLVNRLRIRAAVRAHPQLAQVPIVAPLFIVGLPRTGTTLLQKLLAGLPGLRTPLRWETSVGAAPPAVATKRQINAQIRHARDESNVVNALSPNLASAHEIGARLPEECNPLLMTSLRALFFCLLFDCPDYEDQLYASGFRHAYDWHKLHLQWLSYGQPASTWSLKAPAHLASLDSLLATYPDARIVFMHRDPVESVPSMGGLSACLRMLVSPTIDRAEIGRVLLPTLRRMQEAAATVRERWPATAPRYLDLRYDDLVRDPAATVRGVLRHFDLPDGPGVAAALDEHLRASAQQRPRRPHRYSLPEFALDAGTIRASLDRECAWLEGARASAPVAGESSA